MSAVVTARGAGQAVRPPVGAAGLHPGDPRGPGDRPGRPQRRRQDDAAQPGRRAPDARPSGRSRSAAGGPRPARPSWPRSASSPRTPRPTPGFTVAEHLRLGAHLNPRWDDAAARRRIDRLGLDPQQKAGRLSGGQRAQLALTLGLAKRPELLILDEPVASLDPLARREFLQVLMEAVAEDEISVLLSSHVVSDLERVCDHAVVLVDSQVRVAGDVDDLLATHHRLSGPRREPGTLPADQHVVWASHTDRQSTYVVRTESPVLDPAWSTSPWVWRTWCWPTWRAPARAAAEPAAGGAPMTWLTWRQLRLPVAVVYALVAAACVVARPHRPRARPPGPHQRRPVRRAHLHRPAALQRRHRRARAWRRRCSGSSGARRWWPASWRAAPTGWPGTSR